MGSQTAAGSSLAISASAPVTQDAAGYAALTFTDIGQVEKLGSFGASFAKAEFQPLRGAKQKYKGSADFGAIQPSIAIDSADAGQALLQTASDDETQKLYSFCVTYPDGAKRYFRARVFGSPETADGADSMLMVTPTVEISTKVVKVAAIAGTPTPAPTFATQPSVTPTTGTAGTATYTATPGTVMNGIISSRAWLLNGTSISTTLSASPQSAGTLTYQETAAGDGGSATSSVISASVAAAASPTVTLSAAQSKSEGNSGATLFTYTVTRSASSGAVAVPWSFTAGGTSADDFTGGTFPAGGTVNMADGVATGTFSVSVNGDTVVEGNETFTVFISTPSGYVAGTGTSATGTIVNDDVAPTNLTVARNPAFVGSAYNSTVSGKTAGSTLSLAGAGAAGLSVTGSTISGTPTAVGPVNIVETFADSTTKTWTGALTTSTVRNTATRFWLSGGGTVNNAISAFQGESATLNIGTIQHCIEVEGKPTRVRLILVNQDDTDTQDYLGASMVASPSLDDKFQDALFASPTIFDFGQNGNPIITVPPRTGGQQNNNIRFSDWKLFVAVERTDSATAPAGSKRSDGTLPYLMYVRLAVPIFAADGTTSRRITYHNRTGAEWATGRSQIWASSDVGTAPKLTGAWNSAKSFSASNEGFINYAILAGVEYEYEGGKIITVMACGSSYTSGGSDDLQSHSGVLRGFRAASTKAQPVESINYGMATKPVLEARQAFDSAIAAGLQPTHLEWEYANPNSCGKWGSTESAAQGIENDLETARLAVFASAQNAGVVPFVINGTREMTILPQA